MTNKVDSEQTDPIELALDNKIATEFLEKIKKGTLQTKNVAE